MGKTLSDIDVNYKDIVSQLSMNMRIDYCNNVVDKAQFILEKKRKHLSPKQKEELRVMILAAQGEIRTTRSNPK